MLHFAITGNATTDGRPIYRSFDGSWSPRLEDASLTTDPAHRDEALAAARTQEREVCDPYAIEVELSEHAPVPVRLRERIRATGPTV